MQPFLSGETTLAILLTVLTLLFFAAAGDEHPYESYHHSLPVEAGRSSVDLSHEQPQQIQRRQELIVRLNGLQTHGSGGGDHQSVPAKEEEDHQRKPAEVEMMMVKKPRGAISFQAKPPRLSTTSTSPFIPTSPRLLRPPRNLKILVAALLSHSRSHQSHYHRPRRSLLLHTATPFSTVLKSGGADMSWLLEALLGLLLLGMGLPSSMVATTKKTTSSLRCPTTKRSKRRKSVKFAVDNGGDGGGDGEQQIGQRQYESCGGGGEEVSLRQRAPGAELSGGSST